MGEKRLRQTKTGSASSDKVLARNLNSLGGKNIFCQKFSNTQCDRAREEMNENLIILYF